MTEVFWKSLIFLSKLNSENKEFFFVERVFRQSNLEIEYRIVSNIGSNASFIHYSERNKTNKKKKIIEFGIKKSNTIFLYQEPHMTGYDIEIPFECSTFVGMKDEEDEHFDILYLTLKYGRIFDLLKDVTFPELEMIINNYKNRPSSWTKLV